MQKLQLKWKHWYWYCAVSTSTLSTIIAGIMIILIQKTILTPSDLSSLIILCVSFPALMTLFFVYTFKTSKEAYLCKEIIKPERYKYFQIGFFTTFCMFSIYILFWFLAWHTGKSGFFWAILIISMILGCLSSIFFTMYEFCFAFDLFYSKNKHDIIKDFLKENPENKKKI